MTRFARAKGSKASNERREEEATPWHVMRQQLAEQLAEQNQAQNKSNISYNLKEILSNGTNTQSAEVWSDFGEAKSIFKKQLKSNKVKNNNKDFNIIETKINNYSEPVGVLSRGDDIEVNTVSKKNLRVKEIKSEVRERDSLKERLLEKNPQLQEIITTTNENNSVQKNTTRTRSDSKGTKCITETAETSNNDCVMKRKFKSRDEETLKLEMKKVKSIRKKQKNQTNFNEAEVRELGISKMKKMKKCGKNIFVETFVKPQGELQGCPEKSTIFKSAESEKPLTLKKKTNKMKNSATRVGDPENRGDELQRPDDNFTNTIKSSYNERKTSEVNNNDNYSSDTKKHSNSSQNNNKPPSNSDNYNFNENRVRKTHFSKYHHEKSFQTIVANGREIQVTHFRGFLVKKDDAVELKNLRKKLLAQNIPKEKLESIMKLERRKAEKALAREKKKVCYHCRQFGHNFSDCPEIKASDMVKTGMCFKCGSLEHSHFECKVLQRQEFRHAVCFVCKEQGHIARQCPLNSQGQYPKGGSCHLCGEVTHLRKDCPKAIEEKPSNSVTVDTLTSGKVEDMNDKTLQLKQTENKKKKVIQFK